MKLEINATDIKEVFIKHHLSDIVLVMSWIFIHLGFFSHMNANDFFIFAGMINLMIALLYKFVLVVVHGK